MTINTLMLQTIQAAEKIVMSNNIPVIVSYGGINAAGRSVI